MGLFYIPVLTKDSSYVKRDGYVDTVCIKWSWTIRNLLSFDCSTPLLVITPRLSSVKCDRRVILERGKPLFTFLVSKFILSTTSLSILCPVPIISRSYLVMSPITWCYSWCYTVRSIDHGRCFPTEVYFLLFRSDTSPKKGPGWNRVLNMASLSCLSHIPLPTRAVGFKPFWTVTRCERCWCGSRSICGSGLVKVNYRSLMALNLKCMGFSLKMVRVQVMGYGWESYRFFFANEWVWQGYDSFDRINFRLSRICTCHVAVDEATVNADTSTRILSRTFWGSFMGPIPTYRSFSVIN